MYTTSMQWREIFEAQNRVRELRGKAAPEAEQRAAETALVDMVLEIDVRPGRQGMPDDAPPSTESAQSQPATRKRRSRSGSS